MKLKKPLLSVAVAVLAIGAANADIINFSVGLDGGQEVPPVATAGTGIMTVTLDTVTGSVSVSGSYSGLTGSQTVAHIHGPAPAGSNAGIIVGLTGTGGMSGTVSGGGTLTVPQVADMLAGLTYINVHSSVFPGGEVRGQIVRRVPAVDRGPWVLLIVLAGASGVWALRSRRRKLRTI